MAFNCEQTTYCVINTTDGPVRGLVERRDNRSYYKFKRIPYAKPPVGRLRFLSPSPMQPWTKEIDCTEDAPVPFRFSLHGEIEGSEDCLYLEISTPDVKPDKPLPVMFWMACYCFNRNIDNCFDPVFLNNENVLFVRSGFRLGPFGFISINDMAAPGNCGLKDLVMAMKWVQKNIRAFGGDPDNVTIFGGGAGGPIVHYMMLSPMATGLFHKAIIPSASALNNWCLTKNPVQPVFELAKVLGITETCKIDVIEELRCLPALTIMKAYSVLDKRSRDQFEYDLFDTPFKPCIEVEYEGQPAFLTKSPALIIKSGNFNKVPLIIGCNNIEADVLEYINSGFYADFQKYNDNVQMLVPKALTRESKLSKSIGQKLLKFYFGGEESLTKDTRGQLLQLFTDYYFLYYVNKTVRLHSQFAPNHPIFYYVIHYAGEWNVPEEYTFFNSLSNGAETAFLFGIRLPDRPDIMCKGSRDSVKTRSRVVKFATNFAKYGNPTPDENDPLLQIKWDPVESKDRLNYLSIGQELTKGRNPFCDRMTFWDELHKEYTFLRALVYFNDMGVTW